MNILYADFNAMTPEDHVCLTTRGSQEDMQKAGVRVGDWVWLGDGELIVGAHVGEDSYWGMIGIAAWNTLVHLDEEGAADPDRIQAELATLLQSPDGVRGETRIFQLLSQLDQVAPERFSNPSPGQTAKRRAAALVAMNNPELALLELEDARRLCPDDPATESIAFEILQRMAPDRAVEARNAVGP